MKLQSDITGYYDKIVKTINSSQNELHLRTCSNMIAQFMFKFIDNDEVERLELNLKTRLDEKANKLGLITL